MLIKRTLLNLIRWRVVNVLRRKSTLSLIYLHVSPRVVWRNIGYLDTLVCLARGALALITDLKHFEIPLCWMGISHSVLDFFDHYSSPFIYICRCNSFSTVVFTNEWFKQSPLHFLLRWTLWVQITHVPTLCDP